MSSQDDGVDGARGLALWVVFGVVALVVAAVVGASVYQRVSSKAVPKTAVAAAPPVAPTAQNSADEASVKVENGVVKFYFASGKADLAAGANEALVDVIKAAKDGRKLVISGFHDATGSAAQNAEVAKLRAFAVRDALKAAGVADASMELKKPEQLAVSGSNAEARRVEVSLL